MKLVIRHRTPRAFRLICGRIARMWRCGSGPRGVALRLRRAPKAAPSPGRRKPGFVDARTFIEERSERHLHFSQHLHLSRSVNSAPVASGQRAEVARDVSPARRAQQRWRQARAWMSPAVTRGAEQTTASTAQSCHGATPSPDFPATPMRTRRSTPQSVAATLRSRIHSPAQAKALERAPASASRIVARMHLARRDQEITANAPLAKRAKTLRHRAIPAVRNRAQSLAEAQAQARVARDAAPARPVTLVYRRAATGAIAQDQGTELMQLANAQFMPRRTGMPSAPTLTTRQTTAVHAAPRFDAGMLDGLADDIIRRIDKRARVERERRGI